MNEKPNGKYRLSYKYFKAFTKRTYMPELHHFCSRTLLVNT